MSSAVSELGPLHRLRFHSSGNRTRVSGDTDDESTDVQKNPALSRSNTNKIMMAQTTAPFGSIRFPDVIDPAKFVRLESLDDSSAAQQTDQVNDIVALLTTTWKIKPPSAIISIPPVKRVSLDKSAIGSRLELALRRGIAEAVHNTSAWVFTGGNANNVAARIVGRAMQYGRSEFPGSQFCCLATVPWEQLAEKERLAELSIGVVHRYVGGGARGGGSTSFVSTISKAESALASAEPSPRAVDDTSCATSAFELEAHQSHFLMVEGSSASAACGLRRRLERHISSNDISGDQIQTPHVLLVIAGHCS